MEYTAQGIILRRHELWEKAHDIIVDRYYVNSIADHLLEEEADGLRQEIRDHPEYLIEMAFVIVDKDRQTVPFFLNEVQQAFIDDLNQGLAAKAAGSRLSLKFLVLKGRQQGFTSIITAYQLACSITRRNFAGYTLADDTENTEAIFSDKAKFPYDQLPEPLKPVEKYNNRRELLFDRLNSVWRVATAGKKGAGRSKTLNFFHGSEAGFWDNIVEVMASLGQALTKDSIQILETTANGYNQYKDLWDEDNDWENKFYEWWRTSEYQLPFESPRTEREFKHAVDSIRKPRKGSFDDSTKDWAYLRCQWLMSKAGLTWSQVYWYYKKWVDLKGVIKQEYPCMAEEAFLASGRCVFDKEVVAMRIASLRDYYLANPFRRGRFTFEWNDPDTKDKILDESIKFVDDPAGWVYLYEEPQPGIPFAIGGDTKGEGKDFYTGTVINNLTGNRCAKLRLQLTNSKPFTWQMYCMGIFFNTALIGVEMNFNTAPIEELERLNYPRQYRREVYDTIRKQHQKRHGWKTDGNTRPLIIDKEIALVEDHIELFNDIETLQEMLSFVYDEDNRPDAENGKHDDLLFSDMIGQEIRSQAGLGDYTIITPGSAKRPRRYDFHTELGRDEDDDDYGDGNAGFFG